jgi:CBS domain-containing membrane protein
VILDLLRVFVPAPLQTGYAERLKGAVGALFGIAVTGLISTLWAGSNGDLPMLIAPMGASAVLLFAVPASPLAQPWSLIGGNIVAAVIGVTIARLIGDPLVAAALAVGGAVAAMSFLRCIHPPSGAVALSAVLGGPHVLEAGYSFIFVPVMLNSLVLVIGAMIYNRAMGLTYPHHSHRPVHPHQPLQPTVLIEADFVDVLADYGEPLDIAPEDLRALYVELRARADERRRASSK